MVPEAEITDNSKHMLEEMIGPRHLLRVTEVKPSLHEKAVGITTDQIYRVSSDKPDRILFGHLGLPASSSVRCVKVPARKITLPPLAAQRCDLARSARETNEVVVFLDTSSTGSHVKAILAAHIGNEWWGLYRWALRGVRLAFPAWISERPERDR
ncbi:MAG: hypothetical protein ACOC6S_01165 [Chloroflexota bacterium]